MTSSSPASPIIPLQTAPSALPTLPVRDLLLNDQPALLARQTRNLKRWRAFLLLFTLVIMVSGKARLAISPVFDAGVNLMAAQNIWHGDFPLQTDHTNGRLTWMPFIDAPFVALFGRNSFAAMGADLVCEALIAYLLYCLARAYWGEVVAHIAVLLALFWLNTLVFAVEVNRSEPYSIAFNLGCLLAWRAARTRDKEGLASLKYDLLAGFLGVMPLLLRPNEMSGLAAMGVLAVLSWQQKRSWHAVIRFVLATSLALGLLVVAVELYAALVAPRASLVTAFTLGTNYLTGWGHNQGVDRFDARMMQLLNIWHSFWWVVPFPFLVLAATIDLTERVVLGRVPALWALPVAWVLFDSLGVLVSPRAYDHYFSLLAGSWGLLAAYTLLRAEQIRGRHPVWVGTFTVVLVVLLLFCGWQHFKWVTKSKTGDIPLILAALQVDIEQNSRPNDPIYIFGFSPDLYIRSGRKPASPRWPNMPEWANLPPARLREIVGEILEDFAKHPPQMIIVQVAAPWPHRVQPYGLWPDPDYPDATTEPGKSIHEALQPLREYALTHYALLNSMAGMQVIVRRPEAMNPLRW